MFSPLIYKSEPVLARPNRNNNRNNQNNRNNNQPISQFLKSATESNNQDMVPMRSYNAPAVNNPLRFRDYMTGGNRFNYNNNSSNNNSSNSDGRHLSLPIFEYKRYIQHFDSNTCKLEVSVDGHTKRLENLKLQNTRFTNEYNNSSNCVSISLSNGLAESVDNDIRRGLNNGVSVCSVRRVVFTLVYNSRRYRITELTFNADGFIEKFISPCNHREMKVNFVTCLKNVTNNNSSNDNSNGNRSSGGITLKTDFFAHRNLRFEFVRNKTKLIIKNLSLRSYKNIREDVSLHFDVSLGSQRRKESVSFRLLRDRGNGSKQVLVSEDLQYKFPHAGSSRSVGEIFLSSYFSTSNNNSFNNNNGNGSGSKVYREMRITSSGSSFSEKFISFEPFQIFNTSERKGIRLFLRDIPSNLSAESFISTLRSRDLSLLFEIQSAINSSNSSNSSNNNSNSNSRKEVIRDFSITSFKTEKINGVEMLALDLSFDSNRYSNICRMLGSSDFSFLVQLTDNSINNMNNNSGDGDLLGKVRTCRVRYRNGEADFTLDYQPTPLFFSASNPVTPGGSGGGSGTPVVNSGVPEVTVVEIDETEGSASGSTSRNPRNSSGEGMSKTTKVLVFGGIALESGGVLYCVFTFLM